MKSDKPLQLPLEGKLSPKVTDEVVQFYVCAAFIGGSILCSYV